MYNNTRYIVDKQLFVLITLHMNIMRCCKSLLQSMNVMYIQLIQLNNYRADACCSIVFNSPDSANRTVYHHSVQCNT